MGGLILLTGTVLGLAYAGSPSRLPAGSEIAGIDVSGLTTAEARSLLERRSRELGRTPVVFTAEGRRWQVKPDSVLVDVDWGAAVAAAHEQGEGFGPLRGLKRLGVRVFGGEVVPTTRVYGAAVRSYVTRFASAIDRPRVEPSLRLNGVDARIVSGRNGRLLDREAAEQVLVRALTSFTREPVALPLKVDQTRFTTKDLAGAEVKVETALSAPADLAYGPGGWHLTRAKIARLLELPSGGSTEIQLAGPGRWPLLREPPQEGQPCAEGRGLRDRREQHRASRSRGGRPSPRRADDDAQPDGGAPLDVESPG